MTPALPVAARVTLPPSRPPRLFVVVDTEEEFDWNAPYSRANTGVTAMQHIGLVQRIFDRFDIRPTYVIDFPVASQADGFEPLREIAVDGRCTIGAHLHPWVNPPYLEEVSRRNSFTMNLPETLQREKLRTLFDTIGKRFGAAPKVFKAGRYGLGAATVSILDELGITVDTSICPRMDFTSEDGPSFVNFDSSPFFLSPTILEIPCTVDYTGWTGSLRPSLHRMASHAALTRMRAIGILAKAGAVNQIMLSPEGNTEGDMRALARALVGRGFREMTLSFHSPSCHPGHTPYVRTQRDLDTFLRAIESFCEFFISDLGGVPSTPLEFRAELTPSAEQTI